MQKIIRTRDYKAVHPLFDEIEKFYSMTSTKSLQGSSSLVPLVFDESFEALQGIFNKYGQNNYSFQFMDKQYKPLELEDYEENTIILSFSGGKDSTATALHYKENGFNVYLYHTQGINKSYPDEWKSVKEIAKYLGLPLIIEEVHLEGKLDFPEHPMKNMIIANGALQYGIKNHIGTEISFGNYYDSYLDDTPFYYAGDDCVDMWESYEKIIDKIIPGFQVHMELQNFNDTLEWLSSDKKLLAMCQSCLGAHRFRQYNHDFVNKKYGMELLPHRCGLCWKCAAEYIYMTDHNVLQYNQEYYKHCVDILKKVDKKENGVEFTTIENLWRYYFTYDMKQSKWSGIFDYGKRKRMK